MTKRVTQQKKSEWNNVRLAREILNEASETAVFDGINMFMGESLFRGVSIKKVAGRDEEFVAIHNRHNNSLVLYHITDLDSFPAKHQQALDANSDLNGYTAMIEVLNKEFKVGKLAGSEDMASND